MKGGVNFLLHPVVVLRRVALGPLSIFKGCGCTQSNGAPAMVMNHASFTCLVRAGLHQLISVILFFRLKKDPLISEA